jgi:hypothetical protein
LRCEIREALLTFLQENHPESLPVQRVLIDSPAAERSTEWAANPPPANRDADPTETALPVHPNLAGMNPAAERDLEKASAEPDSGEAETLKDQPARSRTPGNWMPGH